MKSVIFLLLLTGQLVKGGLCPAFNTTGEPRFTQRPAHDDSVRSGHSVPLVCCGGGVDHIAWYRRDVEAGDQPWEKYPPSDDDRQATAEEDDQVMRIHYGDDRDNTTFKCDFVKDGKTVMSNEIRLYVLDCDHLARGPILTYPFPFNKTVDRLGGNLTFPCTGYFGCGDRGSKFERIVDWQVKGRFGENVSMVDKRYSTVKYTNAGETRLQSILTIQSVQEEDLGRTFVCQLASPQLRHGQLSMDIRIRKHDEPDYLVVYVIVGSVLGFLLAVLLLGCLVHRGYGPQIRVAMCSRIKIFAQKPITDEGIEQNAFLYHAEDDTAVATEIKKHLENNNLVTKISHDITGNKCELTEVQQGIEKSAIVLFLYSQNLREDKLANVVINSLVRDSMEKPIVFIQMDKYDPQEALNWNKQAQSQENDGAGIDVASDVQTDGEPTSPKTPPPVENDTLDLKFWKCLPRYKYPDEDTSERLKKNFWCSLRLKIPKFPHQVELERRETNMSNEHSSMERGAKGRSSESTRPLLESPATSPLYVENRACSNTTSPVSPERGVMFRYDEPFPGSCPAPYNYPGSSPAQYSCSDDSVGDRSSAVIVNVDVHDRPGEHRDVTIETAHDRACGENTQLATQTDKDHTGVINTERKGESNNSMQLPLTNGYTDTERTFEEPSDNDNREEGMFVLSGEESQPECNSNGIESEVVEHNSLDRECDQQGSGDAHVRTELQNGALKVETNNVRPKLLTSGYSTESGYSSMSPVRQGDIEPGFSLQENVDNTIHV